MYKIVFYQKENGEAPVLDYMRELSKSKDKDSRIKLNKLSQYIKVLEQMGTRAGEPVVKHLDGDIWELRPSGNRVLFAAVIGGKFVLLHLFRKSTQKTPPAEIAQAKRELSDYMERSNDNE